MLDPKPPSPTPSSDRWILWVVLVAAVVSAGSFLTYFADRKETASDPPWIVDEFNTDGALSSSPLPSDHQWEVDGGAFTVADGAVTATPASFGDAFAVVRLEEEPTAVTVLVPRVSTGSGVVFDFVDRSNFMSVEAAPEFGTWNVYRMQAGRKTFIANSGTNLRSGSTIEVRRSGGRVDISIDDAPVPALIADEWPQGSGAGLLAGPSEQGATMWSRFVVTAPPRDLPSTSS